MNYIDNARIQVKCDGSCLKQEKVTFTDKKVINVYSFIHSFIHLIGIHFMQSRTASTRHGVTRKRSKKRLKDTGNMF